MTTALEQAFPVGANWLAATVRSKLAEATIGVFTTPNLAAEDFTLQPYRAIAVEGPDGDLEFYAYDATDTTTADDGGVTCIVVSGRRYMKRIDVIVRDSALSATTGAQPASPSLGDTYIVPAAPSGTDWASEARTVATYSARGWIFRQPFVGMVVYVEDEGDFYHYAPAGTWVQGLGAGAIADGSIRPKKFFFPFGQIKVVDQRNAPPGGTPTNGSAYQVGTSPSDAFVGHTNHIAMWNSAGGGLWEFFAPVEGDTIYRLDISRPYSYRSGAWVPTIPPAGVERIWRHTSFQAYVNVTSTVQRETGVNIQSSLGKYLRFTIISLTGNGSGGSASGAHGYAASLYADTSSSEISGISSGTANNSATGPQLASNAARQIIYAVPDGAMHNYNVGFVRTSGSDNTRDFNSGLEMIVEELVLS